MDETYKLHQTPVELAKALIKLVPLKEGDKVIEPFKGDGSFFNSFPSFCEKEWAEITQGRDYTTLTEEYDWVITNPPFWQDTGSKRINSFWFLLDYYSCRAKKGIAFLANDKCFSTLTPKRMETLRLRGWAFTKIVVCSIKKWRGRYFFLIIQKNEKTCMLHLTDNF
jgi:type I restriction-modification system DNA methylase subunit